MQPRRRARSRSSRSSGSELAEVDVPGDFSSAAPFLVAAALLPGSRPDRPRRRTEPAPHRPPRRARADGRPRRASSTGARSAGEPSATSRCSAAPLVATESRARTRCRASSTSCRSSRCSARFAHGDDRASRGAEELRAKETDRIETVTDGAARDRRAHPARGPTASSSAASRRARAAARSTPPATTGSRCSARSRAPSRARASRLEGAEMRRDKLPRLLRPAAESRSTARSASGVTAER